MSVEFKDFSIEVKGRMNELAILALEDVAGELESQTKRNTAVRTGQTKNSWQHNIKESKSSATATIGSPLENAIWEEFGTGDYALEGNGRKGGWFYEDEDGNGHFTHGKKPRRAFWRAYTALKNPMIKHIQDTFKGGM